MTWTKATTRIAALLTAGVVASMYLQRRKAARQRVQPRTLSSSEERWEGEGGATASGAQISESERRPM